MTASCLARGPSQLSAVIATSAGITKLAIATQPNTRRPRSRIGVALARLGATPAQKTVTTITTRAKPSSDSLDEISATPGVTSARFLEEIPTRATNVAPNAAELRTT